jgi:hypothetical protein
MVMPDSPGLTLDQYSADRHGFLRMEVSASALRMQYFTVPRPHEHWKDPAVLFDEVTISIGQQTIQVETPAPLEAFVEPPAAEAVAIGPEASNGQPEPTVPMEPRTSFGGP